MKDRCHNPDAKSFESYGGRGIRVCFAWRVSFVAFLRDMGERPSPDHSIERVDNDGGYSPGNCKWATREEQNANKRPKRRHVREGREAEALRLLETMSGPKVAGALGLGVMTVYRIQREAKAGARLHSQIPATPLPVE